MQNMVLAFLPTASARMREYRAQGQEEDPVIRPRSFTAEETSTEETNGCDH
jgi:hypothetical protein